MKQWLGIMVGALLGVAVAIAAGIQPLRLHISEDCALAVAGVCPEATVDRLTGREDIAPVATGSAPTEGR